MKPFPPSSVGADPIATLLRRGWGRSSARTAANAPSSSAWQPHECPVSFFGQTRGSAPTAGRIPITPAPLFGWKNTVFVLPKLHFRCISNTLQRYEKILKLTNCKHKIFNKLFVGAAILLCIKQLQKFKSKILITNDLCHLSASFNCPISCLFWLQITDYSLFIDPLSGLKLEKTSKYVSKNIYYLYIIYYIIYK